MFLQKNSEIIDPFMLCGNKRSYILKSSKSTKSGVLKYRIKVITIIIIKIIIKIKIIIITQDKEIIFSLRPVNIGLMSSGG